MMHELDYDNEKVLEILNNNDLNEDEKKALFERYKAELKKERRKEIISRVNALSENIPIITKEIYIDFLKKYENDDLSKPFEVIEQEIENFKKEMTDKYNQYLSKQDDIDLDENIDDITPDVKPSEIDDEFDDTIFKEPEEFKLNDNQSSIFMDDEVSVLNEEPEILAKPLNNEEEKEVMPEELPEPLGEKGNASAIILSIIAIILGVVIMYSIIKLK